MPLPTDRKVSLVVGIAAIVAATLATIAVVATRRFISDAALVSHTHEVRAGLEAVAHHVNSAKADVRGFLLTGDSTYLRHLTGQIDTAELSFRTVQGLTADNEPQQTRLAAVRRVMDMRESALDQTIALGPTRPVSADTVRRRLLLGEELSRRIDSLVGAAEDAELGLLTERMVHQSRSEFFVRLSSAALVMGAILAALFLGRSISRDLAGRARAEAALRASEAKFSGILAIAADAIVSVDADQSIVHFNRGAEEMFGYSAGEVIGKPLETLLPARHVASHHKHVREFFASASAARRMGERGNVYGRRKDGEEFPAEASISKLETPEGWVFTAVVRDVTMHKTLEHHEHSLATAGVQLAQSLDYEETLTTVASLPVPSVGAWCVLHVVEDSDEDEPKLRRIASSHPDQSVAQALSEWAATPLRWDAPDAVIDVVRTSAPKRIDVVTDDWLEAHSETAEEVEIARRVGVHSLLIVPLVAHDRVLGAWMIGSSAERRFNAFDQTLALALAERAALAIENARLFQRAQRATSARDQVLSVVSHDLRNPLAAMSMFARRLQDDSLTATERGTVAANIFTSLEWMYRLMQDLLDASSIEAGRLSVEMRPQPLRPVVDGVLQMFADRAANEKLELRSDIPSQLPDVNVDGPRITQVLSNLVGNSLKFTRNGSIVIGATLDGHEVVVWVRDTGAGIPAGEIPHVFDRYWHARRGSSSGGNGLGLTIAQGVVNRHGGRIWVESQVDAGTTFFFTLPVSASNHDMRARRWPTPSSSGAVA